MKKLFLTIGATSTTFVPLATVMACGESDEKYTPPGPIGSETESPEWGLLSIEEYNELYDSLDPYSQVGIAIIAYGVKWTDVVDFEKGDKVVDIIEDSKFTIKYHTHETLGEFMLTFKVDGEHDDWQRGESEAQNYGDYHPMYTVNHELAKSGISNWISSPGEIYEITYDHTAGIVPEEY